LLNVVVLSVFKINNNRWISRGVPSPPVHSSKGQILKKLRATCKKNLNPSHQLPSLFWAPNMPKLLQRLRLLPQTPDPADGDLAEPLAGLQLA